MSSVLIASVAWAQQPSITPLDMDLTNYQYPYPVQFISLTIQGEALKMAYMDVKPAIANGHVVMLNWKVIIMAYGNLNMKNG